MFATTFITHVSKRAVAQESRGYEVTDFYFPVTVASGETRQMKNFEAHRWKVRHILFWAYYVTDPVNQFSLPPPTTSFLADADSDHSSDNGGEVPSTVRVSPESRRLGSVMVLRDKGQIYLILWRLHIVSMVIQIGASVEDIGGITPITDSYEACGDAATSTLPQPSTRRHSASRTTLKLTVVAIRNDPEALNRLRSSTLPHHPEPPSYTAPTPTPSSTHAVPTQDDHISAAGA
ncbi:hypothetical protein R3P38DRAFT_2778677 [Favolaschia claudopus]|uniref:Uncharacterized protein n=1 Tax=Favolaschia claudopus TaxID=2862362 RepID=A0AAW0BI60_9AGAR